MRRTLHAALLLAGLAAAGCQPHYDGLRIRYLNGFGEFDASGLDIVEGQALAIEVEPISDNPYEDYEDFDIVELDSFNEQIVLVAPADTVNRFVVVGAQVGTSAVDVSINGDDVDTITVNVAPQEVGP